jgi:BirA family biotin operon repressor/biotin-[acetyl-CoA-carboxylase] ligase
MSENFSIGYPRDLVVEETESTNDYARRLGEEGAPHGSWISARMQTKGRGRLGREWRSTEGNLFLSLVLRPDPKFPMTWVPLAVALGVFRAAKGLRENFDLALKWPNDLVLRDRRIGPRKVGGILCEGVGSPRGSFVVAGVGVNCAIAPEIDQPTASLGVSVDTLRGRVITEVAGIFSESFAFIQDEYFQASLLQEGDPIEWRDLHAPDTVESGTFFRYGEQGELVANVGGKARRLFSEEIKLLPKR